MAMSVTYATVHGRLVEENRGGVVTEYVPDTLGNVIMTTDESGTVTSATTYWPFGEVRTQTGTNPSPWGFCGVWGYLTDAVSRMYVRARHYRADTSRWLSVDPLWPEQPAYLYSVAPTQEIDSSGLSVFDAFLKKGEPCGFSMAIDFGLRCLGQDSCVDNTSEYGNRYKRTGNKLDKCASCVSMFICVSIGAFEAADRIGPYLPGLGITPFPLSKEAAKCLRCQNDCMIDLWRRRDTPLWRVAKQRCALHGEGSRQCCIASVEAEQDGYTQCAEQCCAPLSLIPLSMRLHFAKGNLKCCE